MERERERERKETQREGEKERESERFVPSRRATHASQQLIAHHRSLKLPSPPCAILYWYTETTVFRYLNLRGLSEMLVDSSEYIE